MKLISPSALDYDFISNCSAVAGVDEAGRGPLAGPVVAAAAVFHGSYTNEKFVDSKTISRNKREILFEEIKEVALSWSIVAVGPRRIEALNILEASREAMRLAVQRVSAKFILVDGNVPIRTSYPQQTVIGGDSLITHISAASILAKVYRDRLMDKLAQLYPQYGFEKHAGYPTKSHRQALIDHGPSRIHRRTFNGVLSDS
jgi:ribonuclease HII